MLYQRSFLSVIHPIQFNVIHLGHSLIASLISIHQMNFNYQIHLNFRNIIFFQQIYILKFHPNSLNRIAVKRSIPFNFICQSSIQINSI